eukprot:20244-Heterococcus_DN1.PRE.2
MIYSSSNSNNNIIIIGNIIMTNGTREKRDELSLREEPQAVAIYERCFLALAFNAYISFIVLYCKHAFDAFLFTGVRSLLAQCLLLLLHACTATDNTTYSNNRCHTGLHDYDDVDDVIVHYKGHRLLTRTAQLLPTLSAITDTSALRQGTHTAQAQQV